MTLEQLIEKQEQKYNELKQQNDKMFEELLTIFYKPSNIDVDELINNSKYLWPTYCGDIAVTDFFRNPDLTAEIAIIVGDTLTNRTKRKVNKDKDGYFLKIDGEKWYFRKNFIEFKVIDAPNPATEIPDNLKNMGLQAKKKK